MQHNEVSGVIVDAAIEVHRTLGPGLLESVYTVTLAHELAQRGLDVAKEISLPVHYKGIVCDLGYRIDLLVEDSVIVELKSVKEFDPVHFKQLLTYLRLSDKRLGLLINFNEVLLKNGIKRVVNDL